MFDKYIIKTKDKIIDALIKLDNNKKGFLIVNENEVLGTLTDGDIRRAFLKGINLNDAINDIYTKKCITVNIKSDITEIVELFKNEKFKFVPIVDDKNQLKNIITKGELHTLLLKDIHFDLTYDFDSLNENDVDYEIFSRPWGFYKTTVMNDYFQSKIISVKPEKKLSLQSHEHREEHWIVAHGTGKVQLDKTIKDIKSGDSIYIPKGTIHRLINIDKKENLIITEVQLGDYFGEDDIKRYEDDYGRI